LEAPHLISKRNRWPAHPCFAPVARQRATYAALAPHLPRRRHSTHVTGPYMQVRRCNGALPARRQLRPGVQVCLCAGDIVRGTRGGGGGRTGGRCRVLGLGHHHALNPECYPCHVLKAYLGPVSPCFAKNVRALWGFGVAHRPTYCFLIELAARCLPQPQHPADSAVLPCCIPYSLPSWDPPVPQQLAAHVPGGR
jgi:hypothetical protein